MHPTVHEYAAKLADKMPGNLKVNIYHYQKMYMEFVSDFCKPWLFF